MSKLKNIGWIIVLLVITSCTPTARNKQNNENIKSDTKSYSAKEIWQNYLATMGPESILRNVTTYSCLSESESPFGKMTTETKIVAPDKVHVTSTYPNGIEVKYVLNGNKGQVISPDGVKPLNVKELTYFKNIALIFPEIYFEDLGYSMTLLEDVVIDAIPLYQINVNTSFGSILYLIDKQNFSLKQKQEENSSYLINETIVVDGINLVATMKQKSSQGTLNVKNYDYQINKEIDKSYFELQL